MRSYYECPQCGAHLDSMSERCDCQPRARVEQRASCEHFLTRYDRGLLTGISCKFRVGSGKMTADRQFQNREERDRYYRDRCCAAPDECEICELLAEK